MYYSGIDLHKNMSVITTLNPDGAIGMVEGLPQKISAALRSGLDAFVVPKIDTSAYNVVNPMEHSKIRS